MLDLTTAQQEALAARSLKRRLFIWCEARDPDTGDPAPAGFWDDVGDIVYSGKTYHGSGNVVSVSTLPAPGDLTIPGVTITVSGIAQEALAVVNGRSLGQAGITVSIGMYDVANHQLLEPLVPFFAGVIDDIKINTPEAGGAATIDLICESTSRALTIKRTATRSEASCKQRFPSDKFYDYTGAQRERPLYFGRAAPKT
jgi:hypothetical protein